MDKRFLGILAGLIIIFVGIFVVTQNSGGGSSSGSSNSSSKTTNHVEGQGTSGVTFVEYGDYECPICGAYYQPLKDALTPDILQKIHFQFRNLPLTSIHQNAYAGARAAEAAGIQGKYWEMHDKLYENQSAWTTSSSPINLFEGYAKDLGLNVNQFKSDYSSSKVNDAIRADMAAFGKTKQQQATPTFFLDGKYIANGEFTDPSTGAPTPDKITKVLNDEIAKKSSSKQ